MVRFTQEQLRSLVEASRPPCVSIYLPTHQAGRDTREDPIKLKNLLHKAEEELVALGMRGTIARDLLEPARALLDNFDFWQHSEAGLAIFLCEGFSRVYHLPIEVEEMAVVNSRFHIKPLLPLLSNSRLYYVLALSQSGTRLLECSPFSVRNLPLPEGVALNRDDAVHDEYDPPDVVVRHQSAPMGPAQGGAFHGQGQEIQQKEREDKMFFYRQLDDGVRKVMADPHAPVVLAGVDSETPHYRRASELKNIVAEEIHGAEHVEDAKLKDRALKILEPIWHQELNAMQERYGTMSGRRLASSDLEEVLQAAAQGRVDTLFVPVGVAHWGKHEPDSGRIYMHQQQEKGDEDLLDLAAVDTLSSSGRVVAVLPDQVPGNGEVAAIYRY